MTNADTIEDLRRRFLLGDVDAWPHLARACQRAGVHAFGESHDKHITSVLEQRDPEVGSWWLDMEVDVDSAEIAPQLEAMREGMKITVTTTTKSPAFVLSKIVLHPESPSITELRTQWGSQWESQAIGQNVSIVGYVINAVRFPVAHILAYHTHKLLRFRHHWLMDVMREDLLRPTPRRR